MKVYRNKRLREKIAKRREAGRRGGLKSQMVQRERRLASGSAAGFPARARWSIGLRDNWSGEEGWFDWVSWRDAVRRLKCAMANLAPWESTLARARRLRAAGGFRALLEVGK